MFSALGAKNAVAISLAAINVHLHLAANIYRVAKTIRRTAGAAAATAL